MPSKAVRKLRHISRFKRGKCHLIVSCCLVTVLLLNSLSNYITKKRVSSCSTRSSDSLIVPHFSFRYIKASVAYRGSTLWNIITYKRDDLGKRTRHSDFGWKLNLQTFLMTVISRLFLRQPVVLCDSTIIKCQLIFSTLGS